jgi:hypothetical protein
MGIEKSPEPEFKRPAAINPTIFLPKPKLLRAVMEVVFGQAGQCTVARARFGEPLP